MIDNGMFTEVHDREVARKIILEQVPLDCPIYSMLIAQGRARRAKAEKVEWFKGNLPVRTTTVVNGGAAYTGGTTDIVVANAAVFYANAKILCTATNEVMLCLAVNTGTNTITVERGLGAIVAGAAGSVANGATLVNMGYVAGEGSGLAPARVTNVDAVYNMKETFRETVEISGRKNRQRELTETTREYRRREAFEKVVRDQEHSILFGALETGTVDVAGKRITTMGGMFQGISSNVINIGGAMSDDELEALAASLFSLGGRLKWWFCGATSLLAITKIHKGKLAYTTADDRIGFVPQVFRTHWGDALLIPHRGLSGAYAGEIVSIDPEHAGIVFSEQSSDKANDDGELHLREDVQPDATDGSADEWFSEFTIELGHEGTHGRGKGITGAE
jgi:hypothetical protein